MIQKYLIAALVCIGLMVSSFFYGKHIEAVERDAQTLVAVTAAIQDANEQAKVDFDNTLKIEKEKSDKKIKEAERNVKIIKEIQSNPIYANADCFIPLSGLRQWNDEARGKEDSASVPNGEVSGNSTDQK